MGSKNIESRRVRARFALALWAALALAGGMLAPCSWGESVSLGWSAVYDSTASDAASGVAVDGAGDVAVTGDAGTDNYTAKYAGVTGARKWFVTTPSGSSARVWADTQGNVFVAFLNPYNPNDVEASGTSRLRKYASADGALQWDVTLPGFCSALSGDASGNVCVGGTTFGNSTLPLFVARYAGTNGAQLWVKRGTSTDLPSAVKADGAGNVYLAGTALAKYAAADGAFLWGRSLGGSGVALVVNAAGDAAVAGTAASGSFHDHYMAKWAADGTLRWSRTLRLTQGFGFLYSVAMDAQGAVLAGGYEGQNGTQTGRDFYVCKRAAADGALVWSKRPVTGSVNAIGVDASGDVIAAGFSPEYFHAPCYLTKLSGADGATKWSVLPSQSLGFLAMRSDGDAIVAGGQGSDLFVASYRSAAIPRYGDLLIKDAAQPEAAFSTDDIYVPAGVGRQLREASFKPEIGAAAEFDFIIENDADTPKTFRLLGTETGDTGWKVEALQGATDRWPAMAAGGFVTGAMQPGARLRFRLRLTGEVADEPLPLGTKHAVEIFAVDDATPNVTEDAIGASAETITALVVNSTGDQSDADPDDDVADVDKKKPGQQVTLRAAIEFANARAGKDIITFDIPEEKNVFEDGVPTIKPKSPLPLILDALTIDGRSQDANATQPPVQLRGNELLRPTSAATEQLRGSEMFPGRPGTGEIEALHAEMLLDWPGAANGLVVMVPDCEIRGLAVNQFPLCGLLIEGDNTIIQGNYLGLDPTGEEPRANGLAASQAQWDIEGAVLAVRGAQICLRSAGNLLGGTAPRDGNLIVGLGGGYGELSGPGRIPGNKPPLEAFLSAHKPPSVLLLGQTANLNTIIGNSIGCDSTGDPFTFLPEDLNDRTNGYHLLPAAGILISGGLHNTIGGTAVGEGNRFGAHYYDVVVEGSTNLLTGNAFVGMDEYLPGVFLGGFENVAEFNAGVGRVIIRRAAGAVFRGHTLRSPAGISINQVAAIRVEKSTAITIADNTITRFRSGIDVENSDGGRIEDNSITECLENALRLQNSSVFLVAGNLLTGRPQQNAGDVGIAFLDNPDAPNSVRNTFRQNVIRNWIGLGIAYEGRGKAIRTENDPFDLDGGPNGQLNYPVIGVFIDQCGLTFTGLQVIAQLNSKPNSTFHLEYFASANSNNEGQRLLGTKDVTTDGIGNATVVFSAGLVAELGEYITITSTDAEGNTSEFCEARKVHGGTATFPGKNVSDAEQDNVPHRAQPAPPAQGALAAAPPATGDGNGDGSADRTQANVASFRGSTGVWLTLESPTGTAIEGVVPLSLPAPAHRPGGYEFPVGFVQFGVSGLANGASVSVQEIFHEDFVFDTVFAYGPTPQNAQAHWYELKTGVAFSGDHLVVTLVDGGAGDHDLLADGKVSTLLAPAVRLPPGPLGLIGQPVREADGATYKSFSPTQAGPFAGAFQRGRSVVPAIFAPDGSIRLETGRLLPDTAIVVKKLGAISGDAMLATVSGAGISRTNDTALLRGLINGPVRIAAREGGELANAPGVKIKSIGNLDGTGATIFFLATLQGADVNATNDSALCAVTADGSVRVLVREAQDLGGKKVKTIATLVGLAGTLAEGRWRLDDSRLGARVTFDDKSHAIYSFTADGTATARWLGTTDELVDAPLTGACVAALDFPGFGAEGPAFIAGLEVGTADVAKADDTTLFRADAGGLVVLAREGSSAPGIEISPGTSATFKAFTAPVSGADGRLAFLATVAGVKANVAAGLWYAPDGEIPALLARIGSDAPGGGKFASFTSLVLPDGPDSGPIFTGKLAVSKTDGITKTNNLGLWAVDREGALQLVLRTGQEFEVNGTERTVKTFSALTPPKTNGSVFGYDNAGHVTALVTFTDRTVALLEFALP